MPIVAPGKRPAPRFAKSKVLGGKMEKVANGVYLLTPANVEVSPEERRRITERGLDD